MPGERFLEVVVEECAEETRAGIRALNVMPVVFGHEELAAVHRIVIAVRADFAAFDAGAAVGALAGVREILLLVVLAREEMRDGHRHEVASVDRTFPWHSL